MTEDRAKYVSSTLARARTSAIATADATVDARREASVRRAYVTIDLKMQLAFPPYLFPLL